MPTSDEELRERAAHALKGHGLFRHVSRRILIDLVDKFGLERVGPIGTPPIAGVHAPAVLVVLEGTLQIEEPLTTNPPTILTPGIYVLHQHPLRDVSWGAGPIVSAAEHRAARVLVVTRAHLIHDELPQILVNAMDGSELQRLVATL
jgi:hypothetical protein